MEEHTTSGKLLMRNIRKILINYKKSHKLTNLQMAMKCEISVSEYDKIMNIKKHSDYGCSGDTIYKIGKNLHVDFNQIFDLK